MPTLEAIHHLLDRLAEVPARIAHGVEGWSDEQLHAGVQDGAWSPSEIMGHIRASDDITAYRAYTILVRDNPPLLAFDERRWAEVTNYAQHDFHTSLAIYTQRRAELVQVLRRASISDWQRTGLHEARGPLSLLDVVTMLVEHEEEHCIQLASIKMKRG